MRLANEPSAPPPERHDEFDANPTQRLPRFYVERPEERRERRKRDTPPTPPRDER